MFSAICGKLRPLTYSPPSAEFIASSSSSDASLITVRPAIVCTGLSGISCPVLFCAPCRRSITTSLKPATCIGAGSSTAMAALSMPSWIAPTMLSDVSSSCVGSGAATRLSATICSSADICSIFLSSSCVISLTVL